MIDFQTAIFNFILISAVSAIVMTFLWLRNRTRFAGLGFWTAGYATYFVGTLAMVLRVTTSNPFPLVMGYSFLLGGSIFLFMGLEGFLGKRGLQIQNVILLVAFVISEIYFVSVDANLNAHIASVSVALLLVFAQSAWLVFGRADAEMRSISIGIGIVNIASCLINLTRILLFLTIPADSPFFNLDSYETLQLIISQAFMVALAFLLFMAVNRRLVANLQRDIAEHKEIEKELQASETLYRQMFTEHSAVKLLINPENGGIVDANTAASQFYGYSIESLLQMNVAQINTMTSAEIETAMQDARQNQRNYFVFQHRLASGELRDVEIHSSPIQVGGSQLLHSIIHDITERRLADQELRGSEEKIRQLITSAPYAIIGADSEGRVVFASMEATRLLGYELEELMGMNIERLVPTRFRAAHDAKYARYMTGPSPRPTRVGLELFATRKDGNEVPVDISLSSFDTDAGMIVTAFIRDITERKEMDQVLRHRTNIMEALNQATLDLVNRHEVDDILQTLLVKIGVLLDAADISFDLVEHEDTLITYAVTSNQPLQKGDTMRRGEGGWLSWQAIDSGEPTVLEDYSTWPQRRELYEGYPIHAVMIVPIHQRGRVIGAINILRNEPNNPFNETDVYAARQLAQMVALVLDNAQLYSQLQSELLESVRREGTLRETQAQLIEQQRTMAMFDERQRMARDLHDSVNQSIHSLMLFSETLVNSLDKNNMERARQISGRLQESARQALKETRLLLYQTQVSGQERGVNLIEELNARLANVEERAGIRAQIIQEGSLEHCPKAWHQNLFWIAIEALNNSLKHAQARSVRIIIRSSPNQVELEVTDDGIGFDITKPQAGGYGLRNMQERAELLSGRVTITSSPQKGTSVLFHTEIKEQT